MKDIRQFPAREELLVSSALAITRIVASDTTLDLLYIRRLFQGP